MADVIAAFMQHRSASRQAAGRSDVLRPLCSIDRLGRRAGIWVAPNRGPDVCGPYVVSIRLASEL
jgi:hypothetical protein